MGRRRPGTPMGRARPGQAGAVTAAMTASRTRTRRCVNDVVDAIDAALRALHEVRQRLIGEIRASDDATAARADDLAGAAKR